MNSSREATPSKDEAQAANSSPAKEELKTETAAPAEVDAPAQVTEEPEELDVTVRVAKDSQVRKMISFVMGRLERGGTVTIQALNLCVGKAIMLASIARDRLGDVYQVNSLLVVQEAAEKKDGSEEATVRTTSGIQIILSMSPLDKNDVGYQKPKPKGYAVATLRTRDQQRRKRPQATETTKAVDEKKKAAPEKKADKADSRKARRNSDTVETKEKETDQQKPRRNRRRGRADSATAERQAEKEKEERGAAEAAAAAEKSKSGRRRQRRPRAKADEKERSKSAEVKASTSQGRRGQASASQGRRGQSKRKSSPPQTQTRTQPQRQTQERRRRSPPRASHDKNPVSPPDLDYLGREVPRNPRQERSQGYPQNGGNSYQRRGAPYEVGQSYRYMPGFREEQRDPYFSNKYDGQPRPAGSRGGFRGSRDQPRPGYFPASRRPQHPEQLMQDFDYANRRRY